MTKEGAGSIREGGPEDVPAILTVINDAAAAYRGVIPEDRWHEPYMDRAELEDALDAGVRFRCWDQGGSTVGVMGIQDVEDVTLIRHAYVRTDRQGEGIGSALIEQLLRGTDRPVLVGTWRAASWAVEFYRSHGFEMVPGREGRRLLRRYWSIPERQVETSVVLADRRWRNRWEG